MKANKKREMTDQRNDLRGEKKKKKRLKGEAPKGQKTRGPSTFRFKNGGVKKQTERLPKTPLKRGGHKNIYAWRKRRVGEKKRFVREGASKKEREGGGCPRKELLGRNRGNKGKEGGERNLRKGGDKETQGPPVKGLQPLEEGRQGVVQKGNSTDPERKPCGFGKEKKGQGKERKGRDETLQIQGVHNFLERRGGKSERKTPMRV